MILISNLQIRFIIINKTIKKKIEIILFLNEFLLNKAIKKIKI